MPFQKGHSFYGDLSKPNYFKKGHIPWNKGKKRPEISGKNHPMWGRKLTRKQKKKMIFFLKGRTPWNKGKKVPQISGKKHPNWTGGKHKDANGYIRILRSIHPSCDKYGYILEHRFVAEKCLGRYLISKEVIHHVNGKRDDNRPENLYLFSELRHKQYEALKNKPQLISNLISQ